MPTITYDKNDLLNLIGNKMSDEQLEETIHLMKTNIESENESEITIELTPDRPDLFGIEGLARAVKQYLGIETGLKKYSIKPASVNIRASDISYRNHIGAAVIRNVNVNDAFIKSLMNIQDVLTDTIGRKRKKVAIGIHDLDKIVPHFSYIEVDKNEKIIPLDQESEMSLSEIIERLPKGKEYGHILSGQEKYPVFTDARGIFSFPPIINSEKTRVTENTKNLLVELTGTDKDAVSQTLNIIVTNFADRGATIEAVKIFRGEKFESTPNLSPSTIDVEFSEIEKWSGVSFHKEDVFELLKRMGYDSVENKGKITIYIPPYRNDILHPIDVIEDIIISYGFNNFTPELPSLATIGSSHPVEKTSSKFRELLVGFGYQEIIRPLMTNPRELFDRMNVKRERIIELENPVSEDYTCLRNWLLPDLMKMMSTNKHVEYPQDIFQVGDVVVHDENEETMSRTVRKAAALIAHSKTNYSEVKATVESLLKQIGMKYTFKDSNLSHMIEGRQAIVLVNNKEIGYIGEINPVVLENYGIEMPCTAFELSLDSI
ncbi:MAG: phenylalanine--tRNA ligase subunit beta [Candidatus Aenigmarchaeota archaeon]|nr:phenylalanine--tRNA ligase subunit beta [Candidatus Aenigmarchaeota archaeon]